MGNTIIQAKYDDLTSIGSRFSVQAQASKELADRLQRAMLPLQDGGWQGRGSTAFFSEMNQEVLPAAKRLQAALQETNRVVRAIVRILQAAEEEAAAPFRQTSAGLQPGKGPVPGSSQPANSGKSVAELKAEAIGQIQTEFSKPNLMVTIPGLVAQAWLKDVLADPPMRWRAQLLATMKPPAFGVAPSASDDAVMAFAQSKGKTRLAEAVASNPYLKTLGKGLAIIDLGYSGVKAVVDPSVENFADVGASGLGVWGAFGSSPGALLAGAFAVGYTIGDNWIAPHTTEPLSNALTEWDPLDLGYSEGKYPRTTINWYARNKREMPPSTAADVFQGLISQYGVTEAQRFALDYTKRNNISMDKFSRELPYFSRMHVAYLK